MEIRTSFRMFAVNTIFVFANTRVYTRGPNERHSRECEDAEAASVWPPIQQMQHYDAGHVDNRSNAQCYHGAGDPNNYSPRDLYISEQMDTTPSIDSVPFDQLILQLFATTST